MPSNRRLVFGNPPFAFLAQRLAKDEDFLRDAKRILKLDQKDCDRLAPLLADADGFLDHAALTSLTNNVLGNNEESAEVASIIYRIGGLLHEADMPVKEAADELRKAVTEEATDLTPEDRGVLIDRIVTLAATPTGLARQYKARQLVEATGSELDEFQFICDVRPIFDERREQVEGAVPLVMLRLEYSLPDGDNEVAEVRVTEKQLREFAQKIDTANRKLKLIKELLAGHGLTVPNTKATITAEERRA